MSNPKITPKNLSYDTTLPPFLARLQANNSSSTGRHEFAIARPKKQRTAEDIADDEPVYFDEETGDTLTKSEWEEKDREAGEEGVEGGEKKGKENGEGDGEAVGKGTEKEEKGKIAAIGGSRKRKVGKVIGGDGEEDEGEAYEKAKKHISKISKPDGESKNADGGKKPEVGPKKPAAPKKKGKKIKLSFGDDE